METMISNGSHQVWEYLLASHPDENVHTKISAEKKAFGETYKVAIDTKSKSHIAIAGFNGNESMEETIIRWIHRVCSQYKSFPVMLNNYSGFPPNTIYVRIQDHTPFKQLASQLTVIDQFVRSNGYPEAKLTYHPHLTLAGELDSGIYRTAMLDYSQKTFHESFIVTELVLLKRNSRFEAWKQVNIFRFYPPDTNMRNEVAQQLKHQPI